MLHPRGCQRDTRKLLHEPIMAAARRSAEKICRRPMRSLLYSLKTFSAFVWKNAFLSAALIAKLSAAVTSSGTN
jgi:hypothetical protein